MKATTLLERQHRDIEELCDVIARGSVGMRKSLLPQLACDLEAHIWIEEQLFYPAAESALGAAHTTRTGHGLSLADLDRVLATPADDVAFDSRIADLRALLASHVAAEEGVLFPRMERALSHEAISSLASRMMHLHNASMDSGGGYEARSRLA